MEVGPLGTCGRPGSMTLEQIGEDLKLVSCENCVNAILGLLIWACINMSVQRVYLTSVTKLDPKAEAHRGLNK